MQACIEWPDAIARWHETSNNVVVVQVPDEDALLELAMKANAGEVPVCVFFEPDLEEAATAVAFQPGPGARIVCANLPLAGKELTYESC